MVLTSPALFPVATHASQPHLYGFTFRDIQTFVAAVLCPSFVSPDVQSLFSVYANSLLASLNMRHQLLQIHGGLDDPRDGPNPYGHFAKGQEESALRVRILVSSSPFPLRRRYSFFAILRYISYAGRTQY